MIKQNKKKNILLSILIIFSNIFFISLLLYLLKQSLIYTPKLLSVIPMTETDAYGFYIALIIAVITIIIEWIIRGINSIIKEIKIIRRK